MVYFRPCRNTSGSIESVIEAYFRNGFQYKEILGMLSLFHNRQLSLRTLQRILRRMSYRRRALNTQTQVVIDAINQDLQLNGNSKGYRAMHQILKRNGIMIDRETVRKCLLELDPEGVSLRSKHRLQRRKYYSAGPNDIWHLDGNDKLKPYGFSLHGCIDGFSRKILWLHVSPSNKNPEEVAHLYLNTVKKADGVPRRIRADRGVENCIIAGIQRYFHRFTNNSESSFIFGKSTANQRIEAWWSFLRKRSLQRWMNYFKDMIDTAVFDTSNIVEFECIRFCFYGLLQNEMDTIAMCWNQHRIRHVHNSDAFGGLPDVMYFLPDRFQTNDKKINVSSLDLSLADEFTNESPYFSCSEEFAELAQVIMRQQNLDMPRNVLEAENLFLVLKTEIDQI